MEKIKLVIEEDRLIDVNNPFGEKSRDYIWKNEFTFKRGKIYGVICEYDGGGEAISLFLSGEIPTENEKIFVDNQEVDNSYIKNIGWYVGKALYKGKFIKREISMREAFEKAIREHRRYVRVEDIAEEFHVDMDILHHGLSRSCEWKKWRASLAIGYANYKSIYCFPWLNSMDFYDCMTIPAVYNFFKKFKSEGSIIILPTSREENVAGLADEVIKISNPRFEKVIAENENFKRFFTNQRVFDENNN